MLTPERRSIVELLIALAWSDGRVDSEEMDIVDALLDAFNTSTEEADALRQWAKEPRTLEEVDVSGLTRSDLTLALQHGVLLAYIDGEFSEKEATLIDRLILRLGLSAQDAQPILESAAAFAKSLLPELES